MVRTLGTITLLTLAVVIPFREAAAQDPFSGAILGGATGAIIGGVAGGGRGAAIGAGVGAATGAIIGAEAQRRRGGYYWWRQGCYVERSDGAFVRVSSRYCDKRASLLSLDEACCGPWLNQRSPTLAPSKVDNGSPWRDNVTRHRAAWHRLGACRNRMEATSLAAPVGASPQPLCFVFGYWG